MQFLQLLKWTENPGPVDSTSCSDAGANRVVTYIPFLGQPVQ